MSFLPLVIGAGIGLLQSGQQSANAIRESNIAAATQRWAPFTHANINESQASVVPPDLMGSVGAGAVAGARYMQGGYGPTGSTNVNTGTQNYSGDAGQQASKTMQNSVFGGDNPYAAGATGAPNAQQPNTFSWGPQPAPFYLGNPSQANPYSLANTPQPSPWTLQNAQGGY